MPATVAATKSRTRQPHWSRMTDEQLLQMRLCDLQLDLQATPLQEHVQRLYRELEDRGIDFRPHVWLGEEWFSPDGVPGIAVPFYLAHPRLLRLERRLARDVEGALESDFMRILRHEAGHALDSAYRLRRRAHWRTVFGRASVPYRPHYRARPASRHHVQHLDDWYAQSHPTEDFAETFAVWLDPRSGWRRRYATWPVMRKLRFVQEFAAECSTRPPRVRTRQRVESLATDTRTLAEYFDAKASARDRRRVALVDRVLMQKLGNGEAKGRARSAAVLLREHRAQLLDWLTASTRIDDYSARQILRTLIDRCAGRRLRVSGSRRELLQQTRRLLRYLAARYRRSYGLRLRA